MKVSDWIAQYLKSKGIDYVFGVQGGAVTHLLDSCRSVGPTPIFCHHEQGAAFAAGGYARVRGYGACIATTGPGAANTLTPLLGAWQDNIPMMFISGQCRREHTSYGKPVRQTGTQECAITDVTCQWSKMAIFVTDVGSVKPAFETAYAESLRGRRGPVWLDVPVNVSWEKMP